MNILHFTNTTVAPKKYKKSIAILGDSHTGIYHYSNIKNYFNISIHNTSGENKLVTPFLMNSIGDRGEIVLKNYLNKYQNYHYIIYVFGEPDVRIHLHKQIVELAKNEDQVIDILANKYVNKIITMTPPKVIPIIRYVLPQRTFSMYGEYVPKGSIEDRVRYTSKLNQRLKEICARKNVLFMENYLYQELTINGILQDQYCDGATHYNKNAIPLINKELDIFCTEYHLY